MVGELIVIRRAVDADTGEIRRLLHEGSKSWGRERIQEELSRLFVLEQGKRLLAVLHGVFARGQGKVSWVVVNPAYPESSLRTAMIQGLWGVLCRRPECDRGWEKEASHNAGRGGMPSPGAVKLINTGVEHGIQGK